MTYFKSIRPWPDVHRVPESRTNIRHNCTLVQSIEYLNIFIRYNMNLFFWVNTFAVSCNRMALIRGSYTCCSTGRLPYIKYFLINQRIVPFLTRLVGDLTGMEAGRETTIGDKNNVTKCIH
jgi:hypothetical protein